MAEQPSTRGEGRDGTGARGVIVDRAATARHVEQPPVGARPVRAPRADVVAGAAPEERRGASEPGGPRRVGAQSGVIDRILAAVDGWVAARRGAAVEAVSALRAALGAGSEELTRRQEGVLARAFAALAGLLDRFEERLRDATASGLLAAAGRRPLEVAALGFAVGFAAAHALRAALGEGLGGLGARAQEVRA